MSSKRDLFGHFAEVAKAIANPHRLELLELLAQGERPVEELAVLAELSVANASQHLQQLRRVGLLGARRHGKYVVYRLSDLSVVALLSMLRHVAEKNHAEAARAVEQFLSQRDALEPVSRAKLVRRMRRGEAIVLDVRPAKEFAAGHIAVAVNIPVADLERRLAGLPRRQEIVAYCRGPYCVMAFEAVALLRQRGFKALRLSEGFPEWRLAGLPVTGDAAA